jgi:hypothetical protein
LQNLYSIVDQLAYRRLSRARKAECGIDTLHTCEDFRISRGRSVRTSIVSQPVEMIRIIVATTIELGSNDCREDL